MKLFEECVQTLLCGNMEIEVSFVKGFIAAIETFGIDCPITFDQKTSNNGLLNPNLHIWVIGQIFKKNQADELELEAGKGIVAKLYEEGALGAALAGIGRAILNERNAIDANKHRPDDEETKAAKQEAADTPDSEAVTNQQPAEQASNDGVLTEAEITNLLSEDKQEDEAEQQAEVVEDPEVEGIFYQHAFLFRTANSQSYLTEELLRSLPAEQRREYHGYWVMMATQNGKTTYYDDERHPSGYSIMRERMEAAKADTAK